jgi:hypothetical protein
MIRSVFAFIAVNVFVYLAFAFVAWEINPADWTNGGRAAGVLLGSMLGCLGAIAAGDLR